MASAATSNPPTHKGEVLTLAKAVSPAMALVPHLRGQLDTARIVWDNLDQLQKLSFTEDMVGFLDADMNRKITLRDVINSAREAYVKLASTQYETMEQINATAILQGVRVANVAKGKISQQVFMKGTIMSFSMARKKAARIQEFAAQESPALRRRLELIQGGSLDQLNLALADENHAGHKKEAGASLIVRACLSGFATGTLVASVAAAASSGVALAAIPDLLTPGTREGSDKDKKHDEKPEEKANIGAAQETWNKLSHVLRTSRGPEGAAMVGKALLSKLKSAELATLVQLIKTAVVVMERTLAAIRRLTKPLDELLANAGSIAESLADMEARCVGYGTNSTGGFTEEDVKAVKERWDEVSSATEAWTDMFNEQRISPVLMQDF
ncbi:hypothetical protein B0H63DRAFT_102792 [Podospora didyma]|uniref:EF-hand domain-containing protein n=1 Tax=Podospora didyma TaxID=330526 RepID=A0AAE0NYB2_9PEZI|nr:hypothetical protein B0H63DRAFT_102792 [Podospora didyma]